MTRRREAFAELHMGIVDSVKFGNSSIVDICGCRTILFQCQTVEHRALISLRSNIISIRQLDERGCQVLASHGVLRTRDHERRLLPR